MMTSKNKYIKQVVDGFQNNKGKASIYCFTSSIIPELVYNIIVPFSKKHTNEQIFIVVDKYDTRKNIIAFFNKHNITKENGYDIRILSDSYINTKYSYAYKLIITIGVNDNLDVLNHLINQSKFLLSIFTKNIMNPDFIIKIRNIIPFIDTDNIDSAVRAEQIYSPVEEYRYGVDLTNDDIELYNKYTNYISTSMSIFENLSNIEKCKKGDSVNNISAAEFRNNIAIKNGWSESLDTTIDFMKQIDDLYNPNVLFERACNFYNIVKQRKDLVCDNEIKFEMIGNICLDNQDKKILIVSKRGEYAAKLTKYLNECLDIKCGDYHDCIDDAVAVDDDNNIILVKSGVNKGKPKIIGSQAQSSANEARFNKGFINVLSIKSSSNVKLKIACDIVIFTSSLCEDIIKLRTRFPGITFNNNPTKIYRIYCNNTIENDIFITEIENKNIKVMNDTENFIAYDENSGDIVL